MEKTSIVKPEETLTEWRDRVRTVLQTLPDSFKIYGIAREAGLKEHNIQVFISPGRNGRKGSMSFGKVEKVYVILKKYGLIDAGGNDENVGSRK